MNTIWCALAAAALLGAPLEGPAAAVRYNGALAKAREGDGAAVKRFSLYCMVSRESEAGKIAFVVGERGGGGWAWPERFGTIALDRELNPGSGAGPRLLYEYEGNPLVIPIPLPVVSYAASLKTGAKWTAGKEFWEVTGKATVKDRACWQVEVSTGLGRRRTVWIDAESPLLVALEERVFVGQGDEHVLTMEVESIEAIDGARAARDTRPLAALLKLQADLKRGPDEHRPELSEEQLKRVGEALPELRAQAEDTPWSALVSAIAKDVRAQLQRTDEVARLAEKFVGRRAPAFELTLRDKSTIASDKLAGKIVVLHFWEYQGEPLVEPYGQVGYLDFLYGRRRKLGVEVYGVAIDRRLADPQSAPAALKSFERLREFMHLSYPLAVDDGKLLARFGDPPRYGAKLPLWVVIDGDGKVVHYFTGHYKINPDEGLQELDALVVKLIRERKAKEDANSPAANRESSRESGE